jgi:hypothetical protein
MIRPLDEYSPQDRPFGRAPRFQLAIFRRAARVGAGRYERLTGVLKFRMVLRQ